MTLPANARLTVPVADITLEGGRFGYGAHTLCAAVASELERTLGPLEHADFGGRDGARGEPLHRLPPVRYRVQDGRAHIHIVGPLAHQHARTVLTSLSSLRLPTGDVLPVSPSVRLHVAEDVGVHRRRWWRYDIVTPIWPARVALERLPRGDDRWAQSAWASSYMASTIGTLLTTWGVAFEGGPEIVAVVEDLDWHVIDQLGDGRPARGFTGQLVTNVCLPDGVGLGAKSAFGHGEIRVIGATARH